MMRRRALFASMAAATPSPGVARAQSDWTRRIAILSDFNGAQMQPLIETFHQRLNNSARRVE